MTVFDNKVIALCVASSNEHIDHNISVDINVNKRSIARLFFREPNPSREVNNVLLFLYISVVEQERD